MSDERRLGRALAVPEGRIARFARIGGMASGIAGRMAIDGIGRVSRGERPAMRDLLLTPGNAGRFADQLARMRGAAMKLGQLVSMEGGEILPPELSDILARLRADADFMPPKQLRGVLEAEWGRDWLRRFHRFDVRPIAAASIGQVHRAVAKDGRVLAIKVQYPGVKRSIDSDVSNLGALLKVSGLIPAGMDMAPLLDEARRQLHEEADYEREGRCLARFGDLLEGEEAFRVPALHTDLTTPNILAMDHVESVALESLTDAPQEARDEAMARLISLLFRELFEFGLMQTDPNFANYRYEAETGRVVLLDFGATRELPPELAERYRRLLRAGLDGDRQGMEAAALEIGFFAADTARRHREMVLDMMWLSFGAFRAPGSFDFGDQRINSELREAGMALGAEKDFVHVPPMDTLYLQRKFAGIYLLAQRLRARVPIRDILEPWLQER